MTGSTSLRAGTVRYAERYGVDLALARVHSAIHEFLLVSGVIDEIGEHRIYDTVRNAVTAVSADPTGPTDG